MLYITASGIVAFLHRGTERNACCCISASGIIPFIDPWLYSSHRKRPPQSTCHIVNATVLPPPDKLPRTKGNPCEGHLKILLADIGGRDSHFVSAVTPKALAAQAREPTILADTPTALAAQVGAPTISADTPTALAAQVGTPTISADTPMHGSCSSS